MKTQPRIALFGMGGIGALHFAAIEKLEHEGAVRLVAVADPGADRFPELKQKLGARGVAWHSHYRDLLCEEELEAVVIATPIPLHFEMTRACIERGLYVYLEKPPVPAIQQLDNLIAADTTGRVTVGFQMVSATSVKGLKDLIVRGELGEVADIRVCGCWPRLDSYYNRASWAGRMLIDREPVFDGPATNALAHLIHNIMFLAGAGPQQFDAPVEVQGELYRARRIESYDAACLRGTFGSGIRFAAALTHATEDGFPFQLEVRGTNGWARISDDGALLEGSSFESISCRENTEELLAKSHSEFLAFIGGGRPRTSTPLSDTRGYVLATNGMLVSSGKIRDIGHECVRRYERDGDSGFEVAGLRSAVGETFRTGKLFSEQGLPWAETTQLVSLEQFKLINFADYVSLPEV